MSKSVIFDETVLIKRIRSIEEAVEDEDTWYTAEDFHKIRQRERKLAMSISKAALSSSSSSSSPKNKKNNHHNQSSSSLFHGIETAQQKEERRTRMSAATYSVLCEQEQIWEEDPDTQIGAPPASARIRLAIEQYSYEALEDATARALQNAEDVLQVYCNFDTVAGGQRLRLPRRRRSSSESARGGAAGGNNNNNNNSPNNDSRTSSSSSSEDNTSTNGGSISPTSNRWQSFSSSPQPNNNSGSGSVSGGNGGSPGIQLSSRSSKRQLLKGVFRRGRS